MDDQDTSLLKARLYELCEDYDGMIGCVNDVLMMPEIQNPIMIRNLLSVAYKNKAGVARAAVRALNIEKAKNVQKENNEAKIRIYDEFIGRYMKMLHEICNDVIRCNDEKILGNKLFESNENQTFFLKMKGDYYRYKAEMEMNRKEGSATDSAKASEQSYQLAIKRADELPKTNPVRLGFYLNYTVYLYEIAKDIQQACKVAKRVFDEAIAELDYLEEEHYKDSTLIMQLLRDNLTLWTNQDENMKEDNEEEQQNEEEEQKE